MKKNLLLCLSAVLLLPFAAAARPVSADEAATAASRWLARSPRPLGSKMAAAAASEVRSVADESGKTLFHVVKMAGGGVVVASAETGVEPIVAFLDADDLEENPDNPLYAILVADMASRLSQVRSVRSGKGAGDGNPGEPFAGEEKAWADLLGGGSAGKAPGATKGISSVSDVRVAPLIETRWGQEDGAANYYTPNGYVCGCVALAGAQIARFWRFPTSSRPTVTRTCYVSGSSRSFTSKGGTYSWSLMPATFSSLSDSQCEAIGRLCYDFGVATYMNWSSGGSGTGGYCLDDAFTAVFGYANSRTYVGNQGGAFSRNVIEKTILANLDAGCPVALGIEGHMIDADGYGYSSGTLYTHLNLGWNGSYDAWYSLPVVNTWYNSSVLDEVVYNVFPRKTGDLLTGRVLDRAGNPVAGASVRATGGSSAPTATTDASGIYALWVEGGTTWTVTATSGNLSGSTSTWVEESVSTTVSGRSYYPGTGTPGNSWGNDISLSGTVSSAPSAPSWVDASDGDYVDRVDVEWASSSGATSYTVYRSTSSSGTKTSLGSTASTSWSDTTATAGTTYHYWVKASNSAGTSGFGGPDTGYRAVAPSRPGNDDFANAWVLSGTSGSTSGSSENATRESGEPVAGGSAGCSVWWRWTAPGDGTAAFDTVGSSFDTVLGIYAGSSVSSLSTVATDDDGGGGGASRCEWSTEAGKTYYVQVAGYGESTSGTVSLNWEFSSSEPALGFPCGLDAEQLAWTTSESYPWEYVTDVSSDGVDSARSCGIAGWDTSWAQTTVTGPADVSFVYRKNFYSARFAVTVDGSTVHEDAENCHADTTWHSVSFSVGSGSHAIRLAYTHNGTGWAYEHNGVWVDRFSVSTGSGGGSKTWYVDASSGSDSSSGESWATARRTIQSAVDSAADGDLVLVADGTYGPVSTAKILEIRSVNGAARTIVDGGGTRPCAVLGYDNTRDHPDRGSRVVGLTFQNGYADGAYTHAGVQYGRLENCVVRWNSGDGYGASCGIAEASARNCLVYGNEFRSDWGGGSACWSDLFNCTIVDNEGYGIWDSRAWNSIVRGNGGGDVYTSWGDSGNSMNRCCLGDSADYENDGCIHAAPLFVDAASGDYRLRSTSPCVDAGNGLYVDTDEDLDGEDRVFGDAVDIGCFEYHGGSAPSRPGNDDFANAWSLSGASGSTRGSNVGATREDEDEPPYVDDWGSVWWNWTAPGDGTVVIDTQGSDFDTGLIVYTGSSVLSLGQVASDDDWEDEWSRCEFSVAAGTVYRISVGSYRGERGNIVLNWDWTAAGGGGDRPGNDDLANAYPLSGSSGSTDGSNENATLESGEPDPSGQTYSGASVWWYWTAPGNGRAVFDTDGSDFDTVLAVYTGSSVSSLSEVASDDDGGSGDCTSRCRFSVSSGTTYRISVRGYSSNTGSIALNWSFSAGTTPPTAPSWVSASDGDYATKVLVEWDSSSGATSYEIFRSASASGSKASLGTTSSTYWNDTTAAAGSRYYYWVKASNGAGTSPFSDHDSGWRANGGASTGHKYALCVGINWYDSAYGAGTLSGCVNDAKYFRRNLVELGGWAAGDTTLLKNDAATKSAIRAAIADYASQAVAGDEFVYLHSSHGGQNYGTSVYLCTHDDDYEDTELAADLALFRSGVKVVVIVDACHSGGLFRGADGGGGKGSFDLARRVSAILDETRERERKAGGAKGAAAKIDASEIGWVTAADYDESSMDGDRYEDDGSAPGGVFLASFTRGWWSGDADTGCVGDGDGLFDAYEGWSHAYDDCVYDGFTPQYLHESVLRSVELGECGRPPSHGRPGNDDFDGAYVLWGDSGTAEGRNDGATTEYDEWADASGCAGSVWWEWTAPSTGVVRFSTEGSDFDTILSVYEGDSYDWMRTVATDDDRGAGRTSVVSFRATAGTTYRIAVYGWRSNRGDIRLAWQNGFAAVHRFYSRNYRGHFFTINEGELRNLRRTNPNWRYEGVTYLAYRTRLAGMVPVYRFYSSRYRAHFFTINEGEMWNIRRTNPNWKYEGVAYYVYPDSSRGGSPVFRFWSPNYRHHFFTTSATERDNLIYGNPNWKYEGIAFYAMSAGYYSAVDDDLYARGEGRGAGPDEDGGDSLRTVPSSARKGAKEGSAAAKGASGRKSAGDPPEFRSAASAGGTPALRPAAWTLRAEDGAAIATGGVAEIGGVLVETRGDAPSREELEDFRAESAESVRRFRLSLPPGVWTATPWSAADGAGADEEAEGTFEFGIPANGAWHWLRVRDGTDEGAADAFSLWLRAE